MRAVGCEQAKLEVVDVPDPEPGEGQVLIDVLRCAICGSDLHARHRCDQQAEMLAEIGYEGAFGALADAPAHAKILIDPRSPIAAPAPPARG